MGTYYNKSLGQHFLRDESVSTAIVSCLASHKPSYIIEIGAGDGALTRHLAVLDFAECKALELDHTKISQLQKTLSVLKNRVNIVQGDILELPLPYTKPFWVIGNFPYYLSSSILFKLLDWKNHVLGIVGMFQKEVAERICSDHGTKKYGILSVLMQTYYHTTYLFDVPASAFSPPPKVTSGVVEFIAKRNSSSLLDEAKLKRLVKMSFQQRRKMLRNSVGYILSPSLSGDALLSLRPEQLSVEMFHSLVSHVI